MVSRLISLLQLVLVVILSGAVFLFSAWLVVRLAVSGPSDEVPPLVGLSVEKAEQRLAELQMQAEIEPERLIDDTMPANYVARQDPAPGTPVKRMRTVRLMLASGPTMVQLPSMVGDSRSRALIALEQQGFEIAYVASAPSYEVGRDIIIAQEPDPAELPQGEMAPLRLLSSLGPPTRYYVMVDVINRPVSEVRPHLEALGFRVSEGPNRRVIANVPPGIVVGQQPLPGFKIAHAAEIILQVSR